LLHLACPRLAARCMTDDRQSTVSVPAAANSSWSVLSLLWTKLLTSFPPADLPRDATLAATALKVLGDVQLYGNDRQQAAISYARCVNLAPLATIDVSVLFRLQSLHRRIPLESDQLLRLRNLIVAHNRQTHTEHSGDNECNDFLLSLSRFALNCSSSCTSLHSSYSPDCTAPLRFSPCPCPSLDPHQSICPAEAAPVISSRDDDVEDELICLDVHPELDTDTVHRIATMVDR
jgi:hypothetical protein